MSRGLTYLLIIRRVRRVVIVFLKEVRQTDDTSVPKLVGYRLRRHVFRGIAYHRSCSSQLLPSHHVSGKSGHSSRVSGPSSLKYNDPNVPVRQRILRKNLAKNRETCIMKACRYSLLRVIDRMRLSQTRPERSITLRTMGLQR